MAHTLFSLRASRSRGRAGARRGGGPGGRSRLGVRHRHHRHPDALAAGGQRAHIAFVYADDLWVCDLDGRNVRRLTQRRGRRVEPGVLARRHAPRLQRAVRRQHRRLRRAGHGRRAARLTWHPGADVVQGFTPDGAQVLFTSPRAVFTTRYTQLFTVPVKGGVEAALPIPNASRATYSPDGSAHRLQPARPGAPAVEALPRRHGGHDLDLRPADARDRADRRSPPGAPTTSTRCGSARPCTSARIATASSTSTPSIPPSKAGRALTTHDDFPVLGISAAAGRIVYEQAGYLHLFDVQRGRRGR